MATFEPIIRMDENSFRGGEKIQPKAVRKPLTDMTNSRKPFAKAKNLSTFRAMENVGQTKVARKPLGDVTNSKQPPRVQEKSSKKNCTETVSVVKKDQLHRFALGEGFQHNHDECIKENRLSSTMSLDYFLETVALKRDDFQFEDSAAPIPTPWLPQLSKPSNSELDEMKIDFLDICAPRLRSPPSTSPPSSPDWMWDDMDLELKLKDSPVRG